MMPSRILRGLRRHPLWADRGGLALTEFAMAAPLVLTMGVFGLEAANLMLAHMRVSQVAANLADTVSRLGEASPLGTTLIRESDINDAFEAVRLQSGNYDITERGRVILSSLEQNSAGNQWIHWQRCIGLANYPSTYGVAGDGALGRPVIAGMGPAGKQIKAPANSAVMFVEIIYNYRHLITTQFGDPTIRVKYAFLVRNRRDLTPANNPSNPSPAVSPSTCNLFTA
jgi:hypothetical protein